MYIDDNDDATKKYLEIGNGAEKSEMRDARTHTVEFRASLCVRHVLCFSIALFSTLTATIIRHDLCTHSRTDRS